MVNSHIATRTLWQRADFDYNTGSSITDSGGVTFDNTTVNYTRARQRDRPAKRAIACGASSCRATRRARDSNAALTSTTSSCTRTRTSTISTGITRTDFTVTSRANTGIAPFTTRATTLGSFSVAECRHRAFYIRSSSQQPQQQRPIRCGPRHCT